MIGTTHQAVRWIVKADAAETITLLDAASRRNGFRLNSSKAEVFVEIPRSLRKRRRAARLAGHLTAAVAGTEIRWDFGTDTKKGPEYLLGIECALPEDAMHYYGLVEASEAAGLAFEKETYRNLANNLHAEECVLAVAQGKSEDRPCVLVLTDQRLLVLAEDVDHSLHLNAPLGTIGTVTLGKKSSGETLRIHTLSNEFLVSQIGHGEGHGIAAALRSRKQQMARSSPPVALPLASP